MSEDSWENLDILQKEIERLSLQITLQKHELEMSEKYLKERQVVYAARKITLMDEEVAE